MHNDCKKNYRGHTTRVEIWMAHNGEGRQQGQEPKNLIQNQKKEAATHAVVGPAGISSSSKIKQ